MLPEAQAYYDRGLELFRARDYAGAVHALEQGFAVEPRREFLFAEAQALRLAGECARAIPLYQQFIDTEPQPLQAQAARLGIDRCAPERAPPAKDPAPAPPAATGVMGPGPTTREADPGGQPRSAAPGVSLAAPPRDQPPPPKEPSDWWRDPWALSAAGAGVVALGVGVAALVASERAADEAQSPRTTSYREFDRLWSQAAERRTIAAVALATGAGLLAAGGARALWLYRSRPDQPVARPPLSLEIAPASGATRSLSLSLSWEGRF